MQALLAALADGVADAAERLQADERQPLPALGAAPAGRPEEWAAILARELRASAELCCQRDSR